MVAEVAPPRLTVVSPQPALTPPKLPWTFTILTIRCSRCNGNVYAEQGELKCLHCPAHYEVEEWAYDSRRDRWRIVRIATHARSARIYRGDHLAARRIHRELSAEQGQSRAARVLGLVPEPPDHVTASAILKRLSMSGHQVRDALDDLIGSGHVRMVDYRKNRGYRGYQRNTVEPDGAG